jgi:hypothetical protein
MGCLASCMHCVFRRPEKNKKTVNERKDEIDKPDCSLELATTDHKTAPTPADAQLAPVEPILTPKLPSVKFNADGEEQVDPWTRAFEVFQERNTGQKFMTDYTKYLSSLGGDTSSRADLSSPHSVEAVVNKLLVDRESNRWTIQFRDCNITIRSQADKIVSFLSYSDPIVKRAVSTQRCACVVRNLLDYSSMSLSTSLLSPN